MAKIPPYRRQTKGEMERSRRFRAGKKHLAVLYESAADAGARQNAVAYICSYDRGTGCSFFFGSTRGAKEDFNWESDNEGRWAARDALRHGGVVVSMPRGTSPKLGDFTFPRQAAARKSAAKKVAVKSTRAKKAAVESSAAKKRRT